jgi:hypothetical protein
MDYHLVEAKHVEGYRIWVRFRDGRTAVVDLEEELVGSIFQPVRVLDTFRSFTIHPEFHTLVWPNGADIAPEPLYERARRAA